ncbi:MAG TPA: DUF2339 domain-containing protein, partial [Desulfosarcina sp.]|nr:DUF2339 domain-containing protein [Desulfosarcina sp.]
LHWNRHFLSGWRAPVWLAAVGVQYFLMRRFEPVWPGKVLRWSHVGTLLLVVLMATRELAWGLGRLTTPASIWAACAWVVVPGIVCLLLMKHGPRISWPCAQFGTDYLGTGPLILLTGMALWEVWACGQAGNPSPLPYVPIINPMDISQIFGFLVMVFWTIANRREQWLRVPDQRYRVMGVLFGLLAFCWLNAALARAVHFWGNVAYSDHAMFHSTLFQAAVSILLTVTAFGVMTWSARKQWRAVWFAGAGLLGLVVLKLFVVDLAGTGTVARIVSFLGVGVLMLIVGYVSPLPPGKAAQDE